MTQTVFPETAHSIQLQNPLAAHCDKLSQACRLPLLLVFSDHVSEASLAKHEVYHHSCVD